MCVLPAKPSCLCRKEIFMAVYEYVKKKLRAWKEGGKLSFGEEQIKKVAHSAGELDAYLWTWQWYTPGVSDWYER